MAAFRQGLSETGYVEGQNVAIEYRWAEGQYDRLPALAADLVRRQVAVIAAFTPVAALAAKAATTTIPIVFNRRRRPGQTWTCRQPQPAGRQHYRRDLSESGAGAEATGAGCTSWFPNATIVAVLVNPSNANAEPELSDTQVAARALGLQLIVFRASTEREIDTAFANLVQQRAGALFVSGDGFFGSRRDQIVALAARHAVAHDLTNSRVRRPAA